MTENPINLRTLANLARRKLTKAEVQDRTHRLAVTLREWGISPRGFEAITQFATEGSLRKLPQNRRRVS